MSSSKSINTYVDVDLEEWTDEELVQELVDRKQEVAIPGDVERREVERLYYATRGDMLSVRDVRAVHDVLANLYNRAT